MEIVNPVGVVYIGYKLGSSAPIASCGVGYIAYTRRLFKPGHDQFEDRFSIDSHSFFVHVRVARPGAPGWVADSMLRPSNCSDGWSRKSNVRH